MDSGKGFGSCLDTLETHLDLTFTLDNLVAKAIFDGERVLCGLNNGDLCLLNTSKGVITKIGSSNPRGSITCLAWVGTDKCVSGYMNGPSVLWDLVQCREIAVLGRRDSGSGESEYAIAANAGGVVVLGSDYGCLQLWSLADIKQIAKVKAHEGCISRIILMEDMCITGSTDGTVKVWGLRGLEELATLRGHSEAVTCLDLASTGQCLSASEDGSVRIWDLSEYRETACYKGHKEQVEYVKEISGGRCVSYDSGSGEVRVWNLEDFSDIHQSPVSATTFSVHNDVLYCGAYRELVVLDLRTNQVRAVVNLKEEIKFLHYFEGKCVCVSLSGVYIVKVNGYQPMQELRGKASEVAGAVQWNSDKLISWSTDGTLRVWDVLNCCELNVLEGHSSGVSCAALTSDGRCISSDMEGRLKVWNLAQMTEIPTDMQMPGAVFSIAVTTDGKAIAGGAQGTASVWSLDSYTKVGEVKGGPAIVWSTLLPSSDLAITGPEDTALRVWNVGDCTLRATLAGHEGYTFAVALASGNRCISAAADRTVRVWDLQNYAPLATLKGHSGEIHALDVAYDKCVSGANDCSIILWNLNNYKQEAKLVCSSAVVQVVFINESQFASGHLSGEVKVWDECREIATFLGHAACVVSLVRPNDHQLVSIDEEGAMKLWDLGQLSNCLALCKSRSTLEREISENQPVLPQCRSRIPDFRSGKKVPQTESQTLFRPYFFNALHFCAYYNHPQLLAEYLQEGVPLVRGVFGSPLTLALERSTVECVDVILDYLTSIAANEGAWKSFETINDDLLTLLTVGSSKLEDFFAVIFQRPPQHLPAFIAPIVPLPLVKITTQPYVNENEIFVNSPGVRGEDLAQFAVSLLSWNYTAGSQNSVEMLRAAVNCGEKRVLATDYFRTVIEQKWGNCFPFTLSVTLTYVAMLVCLMGTIYLDSKLCCTGYLALNGLFALYEAAQIIAAKSAYFTDVWNAVDLVRCTLSITWACYLQADYTIERYVTLFVVVLDFIRGFTHFRSFRMTRIFVYMIFTVVAEMYSFLVILAYSIFAFGVFTSVLVGEQSLWTTWRKAYNMAMGNFDTTDYSALEWVVFTGASVTNVVIMMNLLISILGEAYEKAQMTMLENDLHMQASLLLEYETLMLWRRNAVAKTWIVTCRKGGEGEQMEWSGKVLQIVNSLTSGLARVETEITGKVAGVEAKMKGIDEIKQRVAGIEDKVAGLGTKLDAVLEFLQSRS